MFAYFLNVSWFSFQYDHAGFKALASRLPLQAMQVGVVCDKCHKVLQVCMRPTVAASGSTVPPGTGSLCDGCAWQYRQYTSVL